MPFVKDFNLFVVDIIAYLIIKIRDRCQKPVTTEVCNNNAVNGSKDGSVRKGEKNAVFKHFFASSGMEIVA